jgi:predicted hydrocarbon binding protein
VREPSAQPLCEFYAAAFARVLDMLDVPAPTRVTACRGAGERSCHVAVGVRRELPDHGRST